MAFERIQSFFTKINHQYTENDLRHLVQEFLQQRRKTHSVYCDIVRNGQITIRVGSAAHRQAVQLLEYDIRELLKSKAEYDANQLKVYVQV
jgi:hypothetical protein